MRTRFLVIAAFALPAMARAQSLDLTIRHTGLSIGGSRFVRSVRLNFRDRNLELVEGINVTVWTPYEGSQGVVKGLAVGIPMTGAKHIDGAGIGVFGVGTEQDFTGIGVGGFGVGAGRDVKGIMIGGFGVGSGRNITGLTVGGFGAGAGGNVKGITIGGFGTGAGGDVTGLQIGGFGAGAGGDITGITLAGFGAGAGGTLRGYALAGLGVGAPRIRGIVTASAAGGEDVQGVILAPLYFKVENNGRVKGVTVSAFNHVKGDQFGLSLGLLNYAWDVHGWQIGLLNYAGNNRKGLRLLPLFNGQW